jgi:hypothetical protein
MATVATKNGASIIAQTFLGVLKLEGINSFNTLAMLTLLKIATTIERRVLRY